MGASPRCLARYKARTRLRVAWIHGQAVERVGWEGDDETAGECVGSRSERVHIGDQGIDHEALGHATD